MAGGSTNASARSLSLSIARSLLERAPAATSSPQAIASSCTRRVWNCASVAASFSALLDSLVALKLPFDARLRSGFRI